MGKLNIVFRRIHGRIVPIANASTAEKAIGGGIIGLLGGSVVAGVKSRKDLEKVRGELKEGKKVNAKAFLKRRNIKNVHVISRPSDVDRYKNSFGFFQRPQLKRLVEMVRKNENSFALPQHKGKDFIVVAKNPSESVMGHEVGHILEARQRKIKPGFISYSTLLGTQYKTEKRAWDYSPTKRKVVKTEALRSYERQKDYQRGGLIGGASIAALTTLLRKKYVGF